MLGEILSRAEGIDNLDARGGDQSLMQDYFISAVKQNKRVALDYKNAIFGTLNLAEATFSIWRGLVKNSSTGTNPTILHANGDKENLQVLRNIARFFQSAEYPLDIGFLKLEGQYASFLHGEPQMRLSPTLDNATVYVLRKPERAILFTVGAGVLTMWPGHTVRSDASTIAAYEILNDKNNLTTYHQAPVQLYIEHANVGTLEIRDVTFSELRTDFVSRALEKAGSYWSQF
jgi:hypothetical protein